MACGTVDGVCALYVLSSKTTEVVDNTENEIIILTYPGF